MTRGSMVAAALALACLAGCTTSARSTGSPNVPNQPDHARLVAAAKLEPCPPSSGARASGGLPDVTLPCLGTGPAVHLAALRGTPTLVNLWGSWCGPCQQEAPLLAQAHSRLGGAVRFLGVDTDDDPDSALDFAPHVQPPMRYPSVIDDNKSVLLALHAPSALPITVFVDAGGHLVHVTPAPYDSLQALLGDVARYLGVRR